MALEAVIVCNKCNKIHRTHWGTVACSAHISGSSPLEPCSKAPRKGRTVCRSHGANLPTLAKAADRKLALMEAEGEIADLMRQCDIPDMHPIDGLLEVVRVSGSMVRLLTIKVGELREDTEVVEVLRENKAGDIRLERRAGEDAFWMLDKDGQMQAHLYVQLLKIWTERYERACATALSAGIEERRIRLAEDTAETFFGALTKAIAVAGLDADTRAKLHAAMAQELRVHTNVIDLI
jgi:hypothetical protein